MKRSFIASKKISIFCIIGLTMGLFCNPVARAAVYFSDDMEGVAKWTGDAPWATTTASFHSASTAWTDSPAGYYANEIDISMTLIDSIDISGSTAPRLVFWHKYQIEGGGDDGATVTNRADVDGDRKIGLPEVIYALQKLAGMR